MAETGRLSRKTIPLSIPQVTILGAVYKYRFVSRQLLADILDIPANNGLFDRLNVLIKHGYLAKRFEKSLRLQHIPAAYCITPTGMRALRAHGDHDFITDQNIKSAYKDKTVSQTYIFHILAVYAQYFQLRRLHPQLKLFTQRDVGRYDYFPTPPPDAFLSLPTGDSTVPKRFFFDLVSDTQPRHVIERRIASYCQFFENGGWNVTGSELPTLLLVCEWGPAEQRLRRYLLNLLQRIDFDELEIYTTTTHALQQATNQEIWTNIEDPDELVRL